MKRRCIHALYADILRIVLDEQGDRFTHIVYKANLNFRFARRLIEDLQKLQMIELRGNRYYILPRGMKYLQKFQELQDLLST